MPDVPLVAEPWWVETLDGRTTIVDLAFKKGDPARAPAAFRIMGEEDRDWEGWCYRIKRWIEPVKMPEGVGDE